MPKSIPTYALQALAKEGKAQPQDILLMNYRVESLETLDVPHRTAYYGIGLCIRGEAKIADFGISRVKVGEALKQMAAELVACTAMIASLQQGHFC